MTAPAYRYRARLVRVIDADTYELDVDLGFAVSVRVPVRLRGYNAPERFTAGGIVATAAAMDLLSHATLIIETQKIREKDVQSFARYVADVYVHGEHVGAVLARLGHAQPI